ncbi:MAG: transcriptional repressor [Myxococcota bacterium]|nr:transcriptional repressor [Myxococcota bacterium]
MNQDAMRKKIRELLKKHNLRVTKSRMAVMMAIHEKKAPMTHQEIMSILPDGFDKASIWRILANFAEIGLLVRMDLGDRIWRYELTDDRQTLDNKHAHFLCDDCGTVYCLPPVLLQIKSPLPKELEGAELNVRVTGRCSVCLA